MLVVAGAGPETAGEEAPLTRADVTAAARQLLEQGLSLSAAAKQAAAGTPFARGEIYKALLAEREAAPDEAGE